MVGNAHPTRREPELLARARQVHLGRPREDGPLLLFSKRLASPAEPRGGRRQHEKIDEIEPSNTALVHESSLPAKMN